MLGLVNYASDEEQQEEEQQQVQQQPAAAVPKKTKKRKHSALKSMMQKLGVDVTALKQGKITTTLIAEDKNKQNAEEDEEAAPPTVQDENNDDDNENEETEEPESKRPRLEKETFSFKGPKPAEVAESYGAQPSMQEGSDFMKKFNNLINANKPAEEAPTTTTTRRVPKPIFNSTVSTIAPKPITTSVPTPSILGMSETKKPIIQRKSQVPIIQQQQEATTSKQDDDEEDEFEVDASAYDDGTAPEDVEQEPLIEQQEDEPNMAPQVSDEAPTIESEIQDDDYLPPPTQADAAPKPKKALPKHIQEQLERGNVVDVSGAPSDALDEAQRRKVTIERFRRQLYTQPKTSVDLVSMANMLDPSRLESSSNRGKVKHQIAYLARDLVQKELDLAERQENSSKSRSTSWRKYGWR